jgi:hypothetical protein
MGIDSHLSTRVDTQSPKYLEMAQGHISLSKYYTINWYWSIQTCYCRYSNVNQSFTLLSVNQSAPNCNPTRYFTVYTTLTIFDLYNSNANVWMYNQWLVIWPKLRMNCYNHEDTRWMETMAIWWREWGVNIFMSFNQVMWAACMSWAIAL